MAPSQSGLELASPGFPGAAPGGEFPREALPRNRPHASRTMDPRPRTRAGRSVPPDPLAVQTDGVCRNYGTHPKREGAENAPHSVPGISSLDSGAPPPAGFWLNINAELIVYGATEPGAQVTLGGRPIQLRPDGTFSCRFSHCRTANTSLRWQRPQPEMIPGTPSSTLLVAPNTTEKSACIPRIRHSRRQGLPTHPDARVSLPGSARAPAVCAAPGTRAVPRGKLAFRGHHRDLCAAAPTARVLAARRHGRAPDAHALTHALCDADDPLLQQRYLRHLEGLIALAEKEVRRTAGNPPFTNWHVFYPTGYRYS